MKSALSYFGGKGQLVPRLLPLLPPSESYTTFVEVFGGSAALMHALPPTGFVRVYNDLDGDLYNFWRVLQDDVLFERFSRIVAFTPHSRRVFEEARTSCAAESDPVLRAVKFFIVARQSFSGDRNGGWSYSRTEVSSGMSRSTAKWLSAVDRLWEVHEHRRSVQVECLDFRGLIPKYDGDTTLFYLDPPYISDTRSSSGRYRYEMTLDDHRALVDILLDVRGMCVLSGYRHPLYARLEQAGWKRVEFATYAHAAGRTRATGILGAGAAHKVARTECVWLNPQVQGRRSQQLRFMV